MRKIRTDDPVLLLVHEPDIFPHVPDRVALTLAGHTHGGQIRLPLIWPLFVPSKYGARYAYGHVVEDGRHLIVSGGLGTSIIPARLGVPPEIVHITLGGGVGLARSPVAFRQTKSRHRCQCPVADLLISVSPSSRLLSVDAAGPRRRA